MDCSSTPQTNPLRLPGGTATQFALAALHSVPQAGSQFYGLATPIHEISLLVLKFSRTRKKRKFDFKLRQELGLCQE